MYCFCFLFKTEPRINGWIHFYFVLSFLLFFLCTFHFIKDSPNHYVNWQIFLHTQNLFPFYMPYLFVICQNQSVEILKKSIHFNLQSVACFHYCNHWLLLVILLLLPPLWQIHTHIQL